MRKFLFILAALAVLAYVAVQLVPTGSEEPVVHEDPAQQESDTADSTPADHTPESLSPSGSGQAGPPEVHDMREQVDAERSSGTEPEASSSRRVVGRVVDESGTPIQGASVQLIRAITAFGARTGGTERVGEPVATDGQGRYSMENNWLWFLVEARAPGRAPVRTPQVSGIGETIEVPDLVMYPGVALVGSVTSDDGGKPVAGATVTVAEADAGLSVNNGEISWQGDSQVVHTTTDATGRFEAAGLGHRQYTIAVRAEEHAPAVIERSLFAARGRTEVSVDVRLRKSSGILSGRVIGLDGRGVDGARITGLASPLGAPPHRVIGQSGDDGTFELTGMLPEPYELNAAKAGMASAASVTARPGDHVTIELGVLGRIAGRVIDATGSAVSNAAVGAYLVHGNTLKLVRQARREQAAGSFTVFPLEPGRYVLQARTPSGLTVQSEPIDIVMGTVLTGVELVLPAGAAVSGRALGPDGSPAANAEVALLGADFDVSNPAAGVMLVNARRTLAGGDGRFVLNDVAPGSYSVRVSRGDGIATLVRLVEVDAAQRVDVGHIRLPESGGLDGTILDEGDRPVAGATVTIMSPEAAIHWSVRSNPDGTFTFDELAVGAYQVGATLPYDERGAYAGNSQVRVTTDATANTIVRLLKK